MDEVYNRIIDSIRNLPQAVNRKYAFRALSWIAYATRRLTVQELLVAICVEAEQYQLNDGNMYTREDLLDICNGLVVADEDGQAVRLVHFSVRNYLDRSTVIPEDTRETYRAIACSTYLSFNMLKAHRAIACPTSLSFDMFEEQHCSSQTVDNLERDLPFLNYAANNLTFHLSKVEHGHYPEITSAILKLLEDKWHRRAYCMAKKEIGKPLDIPRLNLVCAIGYEDAVRTLIKETDVDANAKDIKGLTPLLWGARMGHEAIVRLLLDNCDVDVNAKDIKRRTSLLWAAKRGHEAVVRLLLDNCDVDVNARDTKDGQTSLSWAVRMRHEVVVKHLLGNHRVDRNCKDRGGATPLSLIICDHRGKILTYLLEKGVEVNFTYKEESQSDFDKI